MLSVFSSICVQFLVHAETLVMLHGCTVRSHDFLILKNQFLDSESLNTCLRLV